MTIRCTALRRTGASPSERLFALPISSRRPAVDAFWPDTALSATFPRGEPGPLAPPPKESPFRRSPWKTPSAGLVCHLPRPASGRPQLQVARSRRLDEPVAQEEVEHHEVDVGLECVEALGLLWRAPSSGRGPPGRKEGDAPKATWRSTSAARARSPHLTCRMRRGGWRARSTAEPRPHPSLPQTLTHPPLTPAPSPDGCRGAEAPRRPRRGTRQG